MKLFFHFSFNQWPAFLLETLGVFADVDAVCRVSQLVSCVHGDETEALRDLIGREATNHSLDILPQPLSPLLPEKLFHFDAFLL